MTATDLLKEVLKDPMLKDKYNLSDEDILSASFDRTSNHQIIEVLKTIPGIQKITVRTLQVAYKFYEK